MKRRYNYNRNRSSDRTSPLYTSFCRSVYKRDGGKCVCCNSSFRINAHHLDGWSWFIAGRYDVRNAVTLCKKCHDKFHVEYGKGKNTIAQFDEFLQRHYRKSINDIKR